MFEEIKMLAQELRLGEGPVWLPKRRELAFVDIIRGQVWLLKDDFSRMRSLIVGGMVGCVVPMENGNLLAAVEDTLVELNPDTAAQAPLLHLPQQESLRFNDGKCDPAGRLWVGTMGIDQSDIRTKKAGSFYCIAQEKIFLQDKGYTIPNGMAFVSENGFYHTDTATHGIDWCQVVEKEHRLVRKRVIEIPAEQGVPDGFCRDQNGNLWVALWGGGKVVCICPETNQWLHVLSLPDKNVSCCTFGGEGLQTLFVTTAVDEQGQGGHLYAVQTGVSGENAYEYRKG